MHSSVGEVSGMKEAVNVLDGMSALGLDLSPRPCDDRVAVL